MPAFTNVHARGFGLPRLLTLIALSLYLLVPGGTVAQGLKDTDTDDPPTPSGLEDAGLIGEREYESPQFRYTVEWERDWDLDSFYGPPVSTDESDGIDVLHLVWTGDDGQYANVTIKGAAADEVTPADELEHWQDPEFLETHWEPQFDVEPLLTYFDEDSAHIFYSLVDTSDDDAQYYTMYETLVLPDGSWVYLTLISDARSLEAAFAATTSEVSLDGESIFTGTSWDDLEEVVDVAA